MIHCIVSNEKEEKIILDFLSIIMDLADAGVLDGAQFMETQFIDPELGGIGVSEKEYWDVVKKFLNIRPEIKS